MSNMVIAGDYARKNLMPGKVPYIAVGFSKKRWIKIDSDTVDHYELQDEGQTKRAGRAIVGAVLAGPVGLAAGALSAKKKNIRVAIYFKDGKKSLLDCDKAFYDSIVRSCF